MKRVFATLLCEAAVTFLFFYALIDVLPQIAIERFYLGTYGIVIYVLLLTLIGFLITLRATKRISLICSIGIPGLFVLAILVFMINVPDFIRIPLFNQYHEYHESIRYGSICLLILPVCCVFVFAFAYIACLAKDEYRKKVFDKKTATDC
jgi:hypothetical protein